MKVTGVLAGSAAFGTFCALVYAALCWGVEVRHSAPYGFSQTVDFERSIAVPGGYVRANFNGFNRVDLDLRAYDASETYDLTVHVKPTGTGVSDVRTIALQLRGTDVFHRRGAFDDPFVTVRFDPIADSRGKTYYVWVERGPRNAENVITVWSIKSYSRVSAADVLADWSEGARRSWGWSAVPALAGVAAAAALIAVSLALFGLIFVGRSAQSGPQDVAR